jgi:hypothetical protein
MDFWREDVNKMDASTIGAVTLSHLLFRTPFVSSLSPPIPLLGSLSCVSFLFLSLSHKPHKQMHSAAVLMPVLDICNGSMLAFWEGVTTCGAYIATVIQPLLT